MDTAEKSYPINIHITIRSRTVSAFNTASISNIVDNFSPVTTIRGKYTKMFFVLGLVLVYKNIEIYF